MTQPERATYSVPEAARVLGVSRNTAYEAIKAGQIPALRIGRRIVVPRQEIDRLLSASPAPAAQAA